MLLIAAAPCPSAFADEAASWEVGLGIGAVSAFDYRGSDERRNYVLPVPYFVYRGERLRVDRRGVRGELLETARASFNVSASLGPPADSDENAARAGMPDLHPTLEIGPSLDVRLRADEDAGRSLSVRLPLRAVIATDLSEADYIGVLFLPHLALDFRNLGPAGGWSLGLSAGPIFASRAYHNYYYAVPSAFATPARPAYDARGGYSGLSFGLTLSKRYSKYWVGTFLRYDNLSGAAFEDSPLLRTRHAFLAGFGVSRILAQSSRPAPPPRGPFDRP